MSEQPEVVETDIQESEVLEVQDAIVEVQTVVDEPVEGEGPEMEQRMLGVFGAFVERALALRGRRACARLLCWSVKF